MSCVIRAIALLVILGVSINIGAQTGSTSNPGWGVVWGILVFLFWMIVVNVALTIIEVIYKKIQRSMDY